MNCITYVYDKNADFPFFDDVDFLDFKDMDHFIGLCEEYGYIVERIVDKKTNVIYFDALPEGTILCMMK